MRVLRAFYNVLHTRSSCRNKKTLIIKVQIATIRVQSSVCVRVLDKSLWINGFLIVREQELFGILRNLRLDLHSHNCTLSNSGKIYVQRKEIRYSESNSRFSKKFANYRPPKIYFINSIIRYLGIRRCYLYAVNTQIYARVPTTR